MNKVSVIVPVYNTKTYIRQCVDSLLNQTYSDMERSTNGCSEICDWYANEYKRVNTYHVKNTGVSNARNIGIENATGEFIAFCDSDDYSLSNAIEHMADMLIKNEKNLCIGRYREIFKGIEHEEVDTFFGKNEIDRQDIVDTIGINRCWNGGDVWNKLFRTSVIRQNPTLKFDEKLSCYEDLKFVLEFLKRTDK